MIAELAWQDLKPGLLARLFTDGYVAARIGCAELLEALWRDLLENPDEQMPWEAPLVDIARNYHGCSDITHSLGDLFYFQPGKHGYIARKMVLSGLQDSPGVAVRPSHFVQGLTRYTPHEAVLERCWRAGMRLMAAITPEGFAPSRHEITIQRLKYQRTIDDFDKLAALARNSLGRWGRAGCAVDERRWEAAGVLGGRGPSDVYGMLMHVPLLRRAAQALNRLLLRHDPHRHLEKGQNVVEGAHYDHRYFTALCGRRDRMLTQIFAGREWMDIPLDLETLTIFPGNLSARMFGLTPVLHRVVHLPEAQPAPSCADRRTDNVTLLIGSA